MATFGRTCPALANACVAVPGPYLDGLQLCGHAVQPLLAGAHRPLKLSRTPRPSGELHCPRKGTHCVGSALSSLQALIVAEETSCYLYCDQISLYGMCLSDEPLELSLLPRELVARGLQAPLLLERLVALLHQLLPLAPGPPQLLISRRDQHTSVACCTAGQSLFVGCAVPQTQAQSTICS